MSEFHLYRQQRPRNDKRTLLAKAARKQSEILDLTVLLWDVCEPPHPSAHQAKNDLGPGAYDEWRLIGSYIQNFSHEPEIFIDDLRLYVRLYSEIEIK